MGVAGALGARRGELGLIEAMSSRAVVFILSMTEHLRLGLHPCLPGELHRLRMGREVSVPKLAQNRVHAGLVAITLCFKPFQHIDVDA